MFHKVLIANRGEIACRIIKTAKKLGIQTVAVFSDADQNALFVKMADEAVHIGGNNSQDSYLNIDKVISAAKKTNAEAIHPGYGFLSENAAFADACCAAGITFIAPPTEAIYTMGSKAEAKKLLAKTNVPLIPGYHGDTQTIEHLLAEAKKIGFPVLIKASAGGGGKGMRIVTHEAEFKDALISCQREAKSSFANDKVILEKYFNHPRHVEIQVFADSFGNIVHLFERDCSIQRRHQKVIEEAPAPLLNDETRRLMGNAAIEVAKSINYVGAGTVEFLLDSQHNFYFMEMNTRLQVEHPVTEMITGLDLVEWQFKVAAGEKLPLTQANIKKFGHAIEARIYAEDPENQFMPSIGKIIYLQEPPIADDCRIDTGVIQGDSISQYYDPMIAKLIVWADTRNAAIEKLKRALCNYKIIGIKSNIAYLLAILQQDDFVAASLSTNFIEDHNLNDLAQVDTKILAVESALYLLKPKNNQLQSLWQTLVNFRINLPCRRDFYFTISNDEVTKVTALITDDIISLTIDNETIVCKDIQWDDHNLSFLMVHEQPSTQESMKLSAQVIQHQESIYCFGDNYRGIVNIVDPSQCLLEEHEIAGHLTAPMPGSVIDIKVKQGSKVNAGDALIILEAMKMEHTLTAPFAGTVQSIYFNTGDLVTEGTELCVIEPEA